MEFLSINKPFVSVVLCTYNGGLYLVEQLDSILNQTLLPTEIIVCDDGSSDQTVSILKEFSLKNPILKLYLNTHRLGFNRNFQQALSLANFEYIAISDQDDVWVNTKLEHLVAGFEKESSVVYCDSVRFNGSLINSSKPTKGYRRVLGTDVKRLFLYNTVSGHAMMIRKDFLSKVLPFPENGYYDWWIAMVACCNGGLSYVDEVLVYQRVHGNNQSVKVRPKDERSLEYKRELVVQLKSVGRVPNISVEDTVLAKRMVEFLNYPIVGKRSWRLFFLIMRNANSLFFKRKRVFPFKSWLKGAVEFSLLKSL